MQVQNNVYRLNQVSNPNFTSIKDIKYKGMYKKSPELANKLIQAFTENPEAMDFCKKYDVTIIFKAKKRAQYNIESKLNIIYESPLLSKFRKFIKLFDGIEINTWKDDLAESTSALIDRILPESANTNKSQNGILSSHIRCVSKDIDNALNKKALDRAVKIVKEQEKIDAKNRIIQETESLNNLINNVIESTK